MKNKYKETLEHILKWKFATDGRKFNGDHKEVLKHIIEIVETTLNGKDSTRK